MTLPVASVLSDDEKTAISALSAKIRKDEPGLELLDRYYDGAQRIEHLGLAVPPELRHFMTVINIPRIAVDEPTIRQLVRGFYRSGDSTKEDPALREAWEYNNLASESTLVHTDEKIFGRSYVSVGSNAEDSEHPLITAESPMQMGVQVDRRFRRITDAFRMYRDEERVTRGTLYEPDSTVHVVRGRNGWVVDDERGRDDHDLGVVPIVGFVHRRRGQGFHGLSEMADVVQMTDDIARLMSNMIVASESLALPHRWASGVKKEDFVDKAGKLLPQWEAYMTAIKATSNTDAKFGQFDAASLSNFHDTVNNMFAWCAAILGLPVRYAGQQTSNPASEGAIRADESRLIARVNAMNRFDGDSWAWVMGLEERFRTGSWGQRNSIRVLWQDPGTQTLAEIADAAVKLRQVQGLSVEGMWDMLGWDEPRKQQEASRLQSEANDPSIARLTEALSSGAAAGG
ncbi:phage portal protein [Nakamurella aerolata]|uniref:Phage portal protein n=1 Tax=Nakamurella aerolata TaxID=1656892 RepID=A0A849A7I1_9ACTN|nr:phage portal protein [Nakamurella aerolata]